MPLRRLSDYTQIGTSLIVMVFGFGILYGQLENNTLEIEKAQIYKVKIIELEKSQAALQQNQDSNHEWQREFIITFKDLIKEIKATNAEVLRNTYHLQSIEEKVQYGKYHTGSK
jgi:sporulation protein YlmC with PRC-barrel domain